MRSRGREAVSEKMPRIETELRLLIIAPRVGSTEVRQTQPFGDVRYRDRSNSVAGPSHVITAGLKSAERRRQPVCEWYGSYLMAKCCHPDEVHNERAALLRWRTGSGLSPTRLKCIAT